jgi:hypothetical protein
LILKYGVIGIVAPGRELARSGLPDSVAGDVHRNVIGAGRVGLVAVAVLTIAIVKNSVASV